MTVKSAYFVTGTDTEIGKTHCSVKLLQAFATEGYRTAALKPIASDASWIDGTLKNSDALALQSAATLNLDYDSINPVVFEPAIAPHIAAVENQQDLNVRSVVAQCQTVLQADYDRLIIEGAGGWTTPLNDDETFVDLAKAFGFPVIIVIGMRLGCLNHATLTLESVLASGLSVHGWIANTIDPNMPYFAENLQTLERVFNTPPLAVYPWET